MEISAFFKAVMDQQGYRPTEEMPQLRVGQELTGKVVRMEADGRLLIDLGSFRALAQSNVAVQPGQVMRLQVVKTGMPLHLQAVDPQPSTGAAFAPLPRLAFNEVLAPVDQQRLSALMHRMSDAQVGRSPEKSLPPQVQQAMGRINTLFDPLPLNRSVTRIAQYLKTVVEDGGLFFEKKLADAVLTGLTSRTPAGTEPLAPGEQASPAKATVSPAAIPGQPQSNVSVSGPPGQSRSPVSPRGTPTTPQFTAVSPGTTESSRNAAAPSAPQAAAVSPGPADQAPPAAVSPATPGRPHAAGIPAGLPEYARAVVTEGLQDPSRAGDPQNAVQDERRPDTPPETTVRTMVGRDVKGQLMILRDFLASSPESRALADILTEKETTFLRDAVQRLLTHVEGQQERAVQRSGENDVFQVFTHWIPVESQPSPVQLKVYYPRKKKTGEGQHQKVALLLDLDRLGMLRVDLAMIERTLRIDFYVTSEDVRRAIAAEADEVAGSLKAKFEQVFITTHLSERKITEFEREDRDTAAVGRIDIQA